MQTCAKFDWLMIMYEIIVTMIHSLFRFNLSKKEIVIQMFKTKARNKDE